MGRVGNARTIADIEFVIEAAAIGDTRRSWTVEGVDCTRDRHRFSGPAYSFTIEALNLRLVKSGRMAWHVLIVTEWWRSETDESLRSTKWLKVVSGKPAEVTAWMRRQRTRKTEAKPTGRGG
ncbi:hypothetical protein [Rhodoplanes azumiensis]|uniref:Uncharacterized protein n=1 Tax=Rhodoplanes azumiensis TaxID=1897628 RepID=A0ABW5AHV9_9BRAD